MLIINTAYWVKIQCNQSKKKFETQCETVLREFNVDWEGLIHFGRPNSFSIIIGNMTELSAQIPYSQVIYK